MSRTTSNAELRLEPLDPRVVPSATKLDLTAAGSTVTAGGAILHQQSTVDGGARNLAVFSRLQAHGRQTVEQGYNTAARPVQFDEADSRSADHALKLSQVPTVVVNGTAYREFVLDVSERPWTPRISLDEVKVYASSSATLHGYNAATGKLGGVTAVFNLDADKDVSVVLDARTGSRTADMTLLVPDSAFAGHSGTDFVYLYSKFGGQFAADGGAEQWSVRKTFAAPPPVAPTATLSGRVYQDTNGNGSFDAGEGVRGAMLTISWTDAQGQFHSLDAFSDANGLYTFTGLTPGTYTLSINPAPNFMNGSSTVGTVNGKADGTQDPDNGSQIDGIVLAAGDNGTGYDFTQVQVPMS